MCFTCCERLNVSSAHSPKFYSLRQRWFYTVRMNHMKLPILTPFEPTKVAVSYGSSDIGSYLPVSLRFWGLEVNEYIPFLN